MSQSLLPLPNKSNWTFQAAASWVWSRSLAMPEGLLTLSRDIFTVVPELVAQAVERLVRELLDIPLEVQANRNTGYNVTCINNLEVVSG